MHGLAAHGHNVTFISADEAKNPQENVHYLVMGELYNEAYKEVAEAFFTFYEMVTPITEPHFYSEFNLGLCQGADPILTLNNNS